MGRLFGRRPDRTSAIARSLKQHLGPGERVLAGVDVQTPGTSRAALQSGASGATGAAVGNLPPSFGPDGPERAEWISEAIAMGIDPDDAGKVVWAVLALTSSRLILLRRSRLTRRVTGVLADWHLDEIDRIEVPRRGQRLTVSSGGATLTFELALAHKFRPAVYDELNDRLADAKTREETS